MKIGIITIHSVYNYGAVLQAYALKSALSKQFPYDSVNVIDYRSPFFEKKKKLNFSKDMVSNLIELERLLMYTSVKRRGKSFEDFIMRNDNLSSTCKDSEELSKLLADYDIVVSGSDQLWNYIITNCDSNYFLNFPSCNFRKYAYASSLGSYRFSKTKELEISNFLKSYNKLSCREKDGCEYIEQLSQRDCTLVCDPTLLIASEEYLNISLNHVRPKIAKLAHKRYLLLYNLSSSDTLFTVAKKIARKRNLKIYQIFPSIRKNKIVDQLLNDIAPEEFIFMYLNADFIITNSFHGTSFSLIFKKDFYTINPTGSNNRILTLLESAGIPDRLITDNNICSLDIDNTIDYNNVCNKLEHYVSKSFDYIKTIR